MTKFVLIGADCEALGHPTECTEPAPGSVVSSTATSVTINSTEIATEATAEMNFPSHSHDHSTLEGCHEDSSHSLDPDQSAMSPSITINGSPVYLERDGAASDPISGGNINITNSGSNQSVDQR